jgi:hypothetical protein
MAFGAKSQFQAKKTIKRFVMDALKTIIGSVFGEDANAMGKFQESVLSNKELSSLLASRGKRVSLKPTSSKTGSEETMRKVRSAVAPKSDEVRCQALVWMLEKDVEGNWIPQRCSRGCESESVFCKGHGGVDGKKCADCSAYHGEDTIHEFKHEHLGTIHAKSYVIDKFWNDLVKYTERTLKMKSGETVPSKKLSIEKPISSLKVRRLVDNPFMNWLAVHRVEIKAALLSENPELSKGRELTTAVSRTAGELWNAMSKEEKDSWKGKKVSVDCEENHEMPPVMDEDGADEDAVEVQVGSVGVVGVVEEVEEVGDDEDTIKLVFNAEHSVWVDEDTCLYYDSNDAEKAPLGQMNCGKPIAFKKVAKK